MITMFKFVNSVVNIMEEIRQQRN